MVFEDVWTRKQIDIRIQDGGNLILILLSQVCVFRRWLVKTCRGDTLLNTCMTCLSEVNLIYPRFHMCGVRVFVRLNGTHGMILMI